MQPHDTRLQSQPISDEPISDVTSCGATTKIYHYTDQERTENRNYIVPEFGSGTGRNSAIFPNSTEIRFLSKLAGFPDLAIDL